jgi:hypothetical protein
LDFRARLFSADKYFGVAPQQRAACVAFLLELAQAEAAPPELSGDDAGLWGVYCAAVEEARALVHAGELDAMELPVLGPDLGASCPVQPKPELAGVEAPPEEISQAAPAMVEAVTEVTPPVEPANEQVAAESAAAGSPAEPVSVEAAPKVMLPAQSEPSARHDARDAQRRAVPHGVRPVRRERAVRERTREALDAWELVALLAE